MNPQQMAMLRMLIQRPAIQPPPPPPGTDTSQAKAVPGMDTGKDFNTGKSRWYIPDYNPGRVTEEMNRSDLDRQKGSNLRHDRVANLVGWRNNRVPRDLASQIIKQRPQDPIAGVPAFNDTGVDERYLAFKNFLTYGKTDPGFSTYYGQGGYG